MSDKNNQVNAVGSDALLGVVLFIYARKGRIRCLTRDEAAAGACSIHKGWLHTATINAARWIEHVVNDSPEPSDNFDELQFPPNTQDHPPKDG